MDIKVFEQKIEAAQLRLENWLQQVSALPTSNLLAEITEEIAVGLEELQVAVEELYQQQEQLQAANREALAERQRYLELFNYAPDGYLITDCRGIIQQANRTASEMFHRRGDFLIGKPMSVFVSSAERPSFYNLLQSLRQAEPIHNVEICLQPSSNRSSFVAAISIAPVRDEQNRLVGYRWLMRDVTMLKAAQEQAQREQERSRLLAEVTLKIRQASELNAVWQTAVIESQKLLQNKKVLIFRLKADGSATVVAESSQPNACYSGQNLNCAFDECLKRKDIQAVLGVSQLIPEYYFEHETSDKTLFPLGLTANLVAPIFVRQQLWGFLVFHHCETHCSQKTTQSSLPNQWEDFEIDVCQQLADQIGIAVTQAQFIRHMEELVAARTDELKASNQRLHHEIQERLQVEESLRRSQEQLNLIADSLPVLISYVDSDRCYRFNNKAYEDWFGRSVTEICGSYVWEVWGALAYQQLEDKIEAVLLGREVSYEMEIPYKNAGLHWVKVIYIPHIDENNRVLGFFALIEDISDRKEIEQMKDEFISVVSHELRTPLTSIHGSLRLLNAGKFGVLNQKSQQLVGLAEKNTDRLVRLVNDILDLERLDSGKITLEKQSCDAADLIATAVATMQELARQQGVSLKTIPTSISVVADPDAIVQTLTNLISNGIKFSPSHSSVWIRNEERDRDILFQVSDCGRGIPAHKLESIFERFQQVDVSDSRQKQGTGLGLAICRKIIEMHGGKIWAESTLCKGSTFYFSLPKAD